MSATLHITSGEEFLSLTAFKNTLEAIVEGEEQLSSTVEKQHKSLKSLRYLMNYS